MKKLLALFVCAVCFGQDTTIPVGVKNALTPEERKAIGLPKKMKPKQEAAFDAWLQEYAISVMLASLQANQSDVDPKKAYMCGVLRMSAAMGANMDAPKEEVEQAYRVIKETSQRYDCPAVEASLGVRP